MHPLLTKLKLIDHLTTTLPISRSEFVQRLAAITDKGSTDMFSGAFDAFSSSKNEFRGQVDYDGFTLKRKRRLFDRNGSMAVARGTLSEQNGQLTIETEINGFHNFFLFIYVLIIVSVFNDLNIKTNFFMLPLFFVSGALLFLILYFIMRRNVKELKNDLEREFFYLPKAQ